jgi:hypothetical protein
MKLSAAAKYFDRDSVYDGYTGEFLFKAQFASYDGSQPDGSFQRRRTVSVAPGIVFPEKGVVMVHGERWLLGVPSQDGFFDRPIRQTASSKQVTELYDVLTPGQAADGIDFTMPRIYIFADYIKDTTEKDSSLYDPQYSCSASPSASLFTGLFLRSSKLMLHLRSVQDSTLGFTDFLADEVGYHIENPTAQAEVWGRSCFTTVSVKGPLDPITELPGVAKTGTGIIMDREKLYARSTEASSDVKPGDMTLLLSTASFPTVEVGMLITTATSSWIVIGAVPYFDAWLTHIRRA